MCAAPGEEPAAGDGRPRPAALAEWLDRAAGPPAPARPSGPDELATIVYTSGTSGPPKGVMLSHRNMLAVAAAILERVPGTRHDVFLSYLPLAHIFERVVGYYVPLMLGAPVVFARSIERLRQDLLVARPTILLVVPGLLERVHGVARSQAAKSRIRAALLSWTTTAGLAVYEARRDDVGVRLWTLLAWLVLERLVARRITSRFGGRLRIAVSGGAPLPEETARFFLGLGLPLVEGYGLTEASSAACAAAIGTYVPGSTGRPLEGVEIRTGAGGEILVRSPGNMLGYWNMAEETGRALAGGWLHTGDTGYMRGGQVFIRGRIKEIIVLSTGENLSPVEIEAAIRRDPLFVQAMVAGHGRARPVAYVVLDRAGWKALAGELGIDPDAPDSIRAAASRKAVLQRLKAQMADFPHHAQIQSVELTLEPWTVETGLLTPTQKLKRHAIAQAFARPGAE